MISSMIYKSQTDQLQKAFKQNYTEEQLKRLFTTLQGKEESQLRKAVDWLILNKTRLPFPGEVINSVNEEASKDWREKKAKEHGQAQDFFAGKTAKTQLAKDSLSLIRRKLGMEKPELSLDGLYQEMLKMEDKYPGIGWKTEAEKMIAIKEARE